MMRVPTFRYVAPKTAREAARVLAAEGKGAALLAGGTDLLPNMKRGQQRPSVLVSLRRLEAGNGDARGTHGIHVGSDGSLDIGALTTLDRIERDPTVRALHPGLARAVASISSPPLRNMGTLGGNLCLDTRCTYYDQTEEWRASIDYCMKEKGHTCWVAPSSPRCWAISATDSVPPLLALGASVRLVGAEGERELPLHELYRDDGIQYLTKARDEVLTSVHVPAVPGTRVTYWKLRRRGSIDFPVLGVGAALKTHADGTVESCRVVLGAVASAPIRVDAAVALLGTRPSPEAIADVAAQARKAATPLDNTDYAMQWRAKMVERYVDGALRELLELPAVTAPPWSSVTNARAAWSA